MTKKDISKLEESIGVKFKDQSILKAAVTHRSYLNEHRSSGLSHNERLEFLGDAVLELSVTSFLFREYPESNEGELTAFRAALVNTNTLSEASGRLGVNEFLLLSKGEAKDIGRARQYILANAFEALVGAIYLDQGYEKAADFVKRNLFHLLAEILEKKLWQDAKSRLQEVAQEKVSITPTYDVLKEEGPDHDKRFSIGVFLGKECAGEGIGQSKQEAEQAAARDALSKKGWK